MTENSSSCLVPLDNREKTNRWKKIVSYGAFFILILGACTIGFFMVMTYACMNFNDDFEEKDIDALNFEFRLWYRNEKSFTILNSSNMNTNWTEGKFVMMVTHGWHDTGDSKWINTTKNFILKQFNWCFVSLDWSDDASSLNYLHSAHSAYKISKRGADILNGAIDLHPNNIYLVGHSLGAQLMSFLAKHYEKLSDNKIGRMTALDPAGPFFNHCKPSNRLDFTDANYVDAVHTDGGPFPAQGMSRSVSHADFYVNKGYDQPNCSKHSCSHFRAVEIWTRSLTIECPVCPCESYYYYDECMPCNNTNSIGYYGTKIKGPEKYYLKTSNTSNICQ